MDKFRSKIVSYFVTKTVALTNGLAYTGIRILQVRIVCIVQAPEQKFLQTF